MQGNGSGVCMLGASVLLLPNWQLLPLCFPLIYFSPQILCRLLPKRLILNESPVALCYSHHRHAALITCLRALAQGQGQVRVWIWGMNAREAQRQAR